MSSYIEDTKTSIQDFISESIAFIQKCNKPDRKEFIKISTSCAIGFLIMGIIGFLIKLLFIPINNILLTN